MTRLASCDFANTLIFDNHIVIYLVVNQEGYVGGLEAGVRGEDGVVGLYDGRGHLRGGVDDKLELGLSWELCVESVHEERGEAGAGPASERVEHDEPLRVKCAFNSRFRYARH